MRIWFPLAPDNLSSRADRQEVAIGISVFHLPTVAQLSENYLRRYLLDPEVVPTIGPPVTVATVSEDSNTEYMRRYLGDPNA